MFMLIQASVFFFFDTRCLFGFANPVSISQLDDGVSPLCHDKKLCWFLQNKHANRFWQVGLSMPHFDSIKFSH